MKGTLWRFRMSEACKNASDIFGALKKIASSLIKWFGQLTQRHMCFGSPLQLGSHWNVLFFFWHTHTQSQSPVKQMTPLKCSVNRDACAIRIWNPDKGCLSFHHRDSKTLASYAAFPGKTAIFVFFVSCKKHFSACYN